MSFDTSYANTLKREIGWYPGTLAQDMNPTQDGVTQTTYDAYRTGLGLAAQSVQLMSQPERQAIYFQYWAAAHCASLPPLTADVVFDHAFNASPKEAIMVLQTALGLVPDGAWGAQTEAAVAAITPPQDEETAETVLWASLGHYYKIALNPVKRPNLESWVGRILDCRRTLLSAT